MLEDDGSVTASSSNVRGSAGLSSQVLPVRAPLRQCLECANKCSHGKLFSDWGTSLTSHKNLPFAMVLCCAAPRSGGEHALALCVRARARAADGDGKRLFVLNLLPTTMCGATAFHQLSEASAYFVEF